MIADKEAGSGASETSSSGRGTVSSGRGTAHTGDLGHASSAPPVSLPSVASTKVRFTIFSHSTASAVLRSRTFFSWLRPLAFEIPSARETIGSTFFSSSATKTLLRLYNVKISQVGSGSRKAGLKGQ